MEIVAHRGSSVLWPENTMLAFDNAESFGAVTFETDLRLSKDGCIVLAHDESLERFGYPERCISCMTAEEICQLEVPSQDGQYHDKIIRLETLLSKHPDKSYIFDCKVSDLQLFTSLNELLQRLNFKHRIWFLTWSRTAEGHVRKVFPQHPYFPRATMTQWWGLLSVARLGKLLEPENDILSLPAYVSYWKVFRKRQIASLTARKRQFMGYIVNTRRDFDHCVACGVRIVLTDRTDLVSQWVATAK